MINGCLIYTVAPVDHLKSNCIDIGDGFYFIERSDLREIAGVWVIAYGEITVVTLPTPLEVRLEILRKWNLPQTWRDRLCPLTERERIDGEFSWLTFLHNSTKWLIKPSFDVFLDFKELKREIYWPEYPLCVTREEQDCLFNDLKLGFYYSRTYKMLFYKRLL